MIHRESLRYIAFTLCVLLIPAEIIWDILYGPDMGGSLAGFGVAALAAFCLLLFVVGADWPEAKR